MTSVPPADPQPEILPDEVESSRAPLLDHLNELRSRLIKTLLALTVTTVVCFVFAEAIYEFLMAPFVRVATDLRGETLGFQATGVMEIFFAKLKVAIFAGIFAAFPVIAWQVYAFVAPGLYKSERGAFWPFLVVAPVLFALGAAFVYFLMLPMLANFAVGQETLDGGVTTIELRPRVSEYLSLVMALMLAFGISFQLPVILTLLAKIGIVDARMLGTGRKYAIVGILAFAAFFTPPDPFSQLLLAVPVYLLYEISIVCVKLIEKRSQSAEATATAE